MKHSDVLIQPGFGAAVALASRCIVWEVVLKEGWNTKSMHRKKNGFPANERGHIYKCLPELFEDVPLCGSL